MTQATPATRLLGKAVGLVSGAILLVLGLMFSLVLVAVVAEECRVSVPSILPDGTRKP